MGRALAGLEAGIGMQGGWNDTFWAYTHDPAPQSHSQSPQTAAGSTGQGVSPGPALVLPALAPRECPGLRALSLQERQGGPEQVNHCWP